MAKKIAGFIKLQIPAGKANPSPPIGPALGQHGVNIMEFCKAFNARTANEEGMVIPAAILLLRAAKLEKGSAESHRTKVGQVSKIQVKEIAQLKMPDLNANDIDHAMSMVAGTARSMGITVEE